MSRAIPTALGRDLVTFFEDFLTSQRGLSPHTIRSYRDALLLLLRFTARELRRTVDLFTVPYSLLLVGPREGEPLPAVGEEVHRMLRLDTQPSSALQRLQLDGSRLAAKAAQKLSWMAERARRSL